MSNHGKPVKTQLLTHSNIDQIKGTINKVNLRADKLTQAADAKAINNASKPENNKTAIAPIQTGMPP